MCSYNNLNGSPTCGDRNLLTGLLRDRWGFEGFVVGDYDAWAQIYSAHHYTNDMVHAAALGLNAGIDQEGGGTSAIATLPEAISASPPLTTPAAVERAFRRLVTVRIRLGMLDPPSLKNLSEWNTLGAQDMRTRESEALNRREYIVLMLAPRC